MGKFETRFLKIPGVCVLQPAISEDARGFFLEVYNKKDLAIFGINDDFVQESHIGTRRHALRGLHFQKKPYASSKLVRCLLGEIFDVIVDLRLDSPAFGQWEGIVLDAKSKKLVYVPEGCAHGVLGLSDWSEVAYCRSRIFMLEYDGGVRWNDPDLKIRWPTQTPFLSEKDQNLPFLAELKKDLL